MSAAGRAIVARCSGIAVTAAAAETKSAVPRACPAKYEHRRPRKSAMASSTTSSSASGSGGHRWVGGENRIDGVVARAKRGPGSFSTASTIWGSWWVPLRATATAPWMPDAPWTTSPVFARCEMRAERAIVSPLSIASTPRPSHRA